MITPKNNTELNPNINITANQVGILNRSGGLVVHATILGIDINTMNTPYNIETEGRSARYSRKVMGECITSFASSIL